MLLTIPDINELGDERFETLIKALLLKVIGHGVTPFTKGKDGAREATYEGVAPYPSVVDQWQGKWIFQVKFSNISMGLDKARDQVKYLIDGELQKLSDYGYIQNNECDNYIYITNVPFSGEAKKGLHDYINKKKKTFLIKNFDYWDGEKVLTLLHAQPVIRETFFSLPGFIEIKQSELAIIQQVFVPPLQYTEFKKQLLTTRYLNIVGQPHVGKTILSKYLAEEIKKQVGCSNIWLIPLIEHVTGIPEVENCVIIFDDLYGDLNYEQIGRKTKIINTLLKKNYIIVTSRDYIYNDALGQGEVLNAQVVSPIIIQEGSYSDDMLVQILDNHVAVESSQGRLSSRVAKLIYQKRSVIVKQLRFPHNLELFVKSLSDEVHTKEDLAPLIESSKEIQNLVSSWVFSQSEKNRRILLTLSIGRTVDPSVVQKIIEDAWGYTLEDLNNCLAENRRILTFDEYIKFNHPSFKYAILQLFKRQGDETIHNLVISVITKGYHTARKVYKNLIFDSVRTLDIEQLKDLLIEVRVRKNIPPFIWYVFITKNREEALNFLIEMQVQKGVVGNRLLQFFLASKDFMTEEEAIDLIRLLLSRRHINRKLFHYLITMLSFRLRDKADMLLEELDLNTSFDTQLYVQLLGVIGSKDPDRVFLMLKEFARDPRESIRSTAISSLNFLSITGILGQSKRRIWGHPKRSHWATFQCNFTVMILY